MIKVNSISKKFKIPHEKRNTVFESLKGILNPLTYETFYALNDLTFDVKQGEFIGIIGKNGSGKSTLLRILAGILKQDSGTYQINGKIIPFLELGLGFNGELTAKENIYLSGMLMGLSKEEIKNKFKEIIQFAELENFIDTKLKNFSSGMNMRLAFSIAINSKGDVYLIDEVLAVGDAEFQKKCFDVFEDYKNKGKTLVYVSHDLGSIERFCNRVIHLDKGKIIEIGEPKKVVMNYLNKAN